MAIAPRSGRQRSGLAARDDFDHLPVLGLAERTALGDAHQVAFLAAQLVVRVHLGGAAQVLAVQAMLDLALDQHRHRLLHLVADHAPFEGARGLGGGLIHGHSHLVAFSTVFTRAMSLRTRVSSCGLASWPMPRCIRRLNCSRRSSISCSCSSAGVLPLSSLISITAPYGSRTWSGPRASRRRGGTP